MEAVILASTSPRRQDILRSLNIPFSVLTPNYDEPVIKGMKPGELAELNSMKKVESVIRMHLQINTPWILGADTLICMNDIIYGKPANRDDAQAMLKAFSGNKQQVLTAISLYDSKTKYISTRTSTSTVSFMQLDDTQIDRYLDTGEWQGVAGGYRIQGLASCFIDKIEGSYSGIVGLPIHELYDILREHGYAFVI
jgi:septum formation protein